MAAATRLETGRVEGRPRFDSSHSLQVRMTLATVPEALGKFAGSTQPSYYHHHHHPPQRGILTPREIRCHSATGRADTHTQVNLTAKPIVATGSPRKQILRVAVVQLLSCVQLFATPWTAAHQASLSFTISRSLLKPTFIESVMSSNHLILCHPLLLPPSIFPSIRIFSNESGLRIRWPRVRRAKGLWRAACGGSGSG